jgi:cupin 2 domain-containing protein
MTEPRSGNLLEIPRTLRAGIETAEDLLGRPGVRIERIISTGQRTAAGEWYDQAWDEWVALIQGTALLSFADGTLRRLGPGDWMFLPAHHRHRVEETSASPACIWLAIHVQPSQE